MALFLFSRGSRIYGYASILGYPKYQCVNCVGNINSIQHCGISFDVQYYIIEGGLIAWLSGRFFIKNRYKKVIAKYDDENPMQRKVGIWVLAMYIIITLIVFS